MDLEPLIQWMKNSAIHDFVTKNGWVWPTLETLHFLGLCLLLGSLILVDLRILGFNKKAPLKGIHAFVPLTVVGFALNAFTGLLFLFGDPERYFPNIAFQSKMLLVFIAGLNVLYFELIVHSTIKKHGDSAKLGIDAKLVAGASLVFWVLIIILGRMIPYLEA